MWYLVNRELNHGFSLIELLITITIFAIIAGIATNMGTVYQTKQVLTEKNNIAELVSYARSAAFGRSMSVSLCNSTEPMVDNAQCDDAPSPKDWQTGWIVIAENGDILRVHDQLKESVEMLVTINGATEMNGRITFLASGLLQADSVCIAIRNTKVQVSEYTLLIEKGGYVKEQDPLCK